ncbi:hypothetical protein SAMN04487969_12362 [Paenibacillus algorifonticola]|uniref:Uncharacterized protein n=1 Tax=Paenibacillus algorifonticola TaxID=684063 RepID=A0A1I2HI50_9BACL|nr:hypothetical protein SAMN04487969_12362 [Paenibacillus algorifonticola]
MGLYFTLETVALPPDDGDSRLRLKYRERIALGYPFSIFLGMKRAAPPEDGDSRFTLTYRKVYEFAHPFSIRFVETMASIERTPSGVSS